MVEGARLESVFRGNSNVGSNPTLSARISEVPLVQKYYRALQVHTNHEKDTKGVNIGRSDCWRRVSSESVREDR